MSAPNDIALSPQPNLTRSPGYMIQCKHVTKVKGFMGLFPLSTASKECAIHQQEQHYINFAEIAKEGDQC